MNSGTITLSALIAFEYILVPRKDKWPDERNSKVAIEAVKPNVVAIGPPIAIDTSNIINMINKAFNIIAAWSPLAFDILVVL